METVKESITYQLTGFSSYQRIIKCRYALNILNFAHYQMISFSSKRLRRSRLFSPVKFGPYGLEN